MHPIVATIPHSGTTLVLDAFRDAGYEQMGITEGPLDRFTQDQKRVCWTHLHVREKRNRVISLATWGAMVICPIRHPLRNYESHKHRSANENHLKLMLKAWHVCLDRLFPHVLLLPVDAEELVRQRHYNEITKALGFSLPIDWNKRAGQKPGSQRHNMPLEESRAPDEWRRLGDHYVLKEIYG